MYFVGIDIGSTACKTVVLDEDKKTILDKRLAPSGWSSKEAGLEAIAWLEDRGFPRARSFITATGYGRISLPCADASLTEIGCHGRGAAFLASGDIDVIDIGGQDTKLIIMRSGRVVDFVMNDKCSAGTGRFLEIMANRLGLGLSEIFELAERGSEIVLSSMCTVFAESEVVSLMGRGASKEDIAAGLVNSIAAKVSSLVFRRPPGPSYYLSGGFCDSPYMIRKLSQSLGAPVTSDANARFAGAIGAALCGKADKKK